MTIIELIASIVGFLSIYLYIRQSIWSWPTSILMVLLYAVVFYRVHLYADMTAQFIFAGINIYGWWQWLYGGEQQSELAVSRLEPHMAWRLFFIAIMSTSAVTYILSHYTDGDLVFWDAGTTVCSLIAQWMLARKILENWLVWVVVDIVYIGMYFYESLWITILLYILLTGLCAWGYFSWKQTLGHYE